MNNIRTIIAAFLSIALLAVSCEPKDPHIAVMGVSVSPTSLDMKIGDSQTLTATVTPENAENKTVLWTSSNSTVASVNFGVVSAVSEGTATITATTMDGGKTATCSVSVKPNTVAVTSVALDKSTLTLPQGDYENLFARITPSNATNTKLEWTSSDESVATVDKGKVTAVKEGKATITVKTDDGGKTATCEVTVIHSDVAVTGVALTKTSLDLIESDIVTLVAKITPENAANKNVSWSSSDETVATVSGGKVTAVKAGSATITVTTEDGGKTATCSVTVKAKTN